MSIVNDCACTGETKIVYILALYEICLIKVTKIQSHIFSFVEKFFFYAKYGENAGKNVNGF